MPQAKVDAISSIFVVRGISDVDKGIKELLSLMQRNGKPFYAAGSGSDRAGGLISQEDVVIIKVNSQWDQRGGTNTDLIRSLIGALVNHPEGFQGEVVIADNGQAQYGSTQKGGSLNYTNNNAEDRSQSMQKVADHFSNSYRVSTYLWDSITTNRVQEYSANDEEDGYVTGSAPNPRTGLILSYPKFRTSHGTFISFKNGVWDPESKQYNSDRLKVINVPVLKAHFLAGVTASLKHYMGVVSDKLTRKLGSRSHETVIRGGMGTQMAETRLPNLNILDAIWVNANPGTGPWTSYEEAVRAGVIAAGLDPAALDYWGAKHILMPTAKYTGHINLASIDPDFLEKGSFGNWLRVAQQELQTAGYQATIDEKNMIVYSSQIE